MADIFSTHSQGENRVTASFLAVIRSLSLDRIQRILGALLEQSEFELVRFDNQPSKGGEGVPDAIIQSSIRILVETKTERDALNLPQINRHLARLDEAGEATALLLTLTPDDSRPTILDEISDERVVWTSFALLDQAIDELLEDPKEVISEREAFLLRELQKMLEAEELLANPDDVVVVAARRAWGEYNELNAYICQAQRSFRPVNRIGFYSKGNINPLVPLILDTHDNVEMTRGIHDAVLDDLVNRILDEDLRVEGRLYKVFLLSPPEEDDTLKLAQPIPNDKMSKTGKRTAFTMGQRYVASEQLLTARTTTDLDSPQ